MVRRGSTGDDSDNDFSGGGGGSDTTAGSGSTGDDSSNDFGGGGGGSDTGGNSGGDSGDDGPTPGGGGIGRSDDGGTDYDPNPSRRETGDNRDLDDITGGGDGDERSQSTGNQESRNQGGAGGEGTTARQTDEVDGDDDTFTPGLGDDAGEVPARVQEADRGVSVTTVNQSPGQRTRDRRQSEREDDRQFENAGLEEEVGALTGEEGRAADAVQTLQGRVDRRVRGVSIADTDEYNIVRTGENELGVELSRSARRRAAGVERDGDTPERTRDATDGPQRAEVSGITGAPSVPPAETDREGPNPSRREVGPASSRERQAERADQLRSRGQPADRSDFRSASQAQQDAQAGGAGGGDVAPVPQSRERVERFGNIDWSAGFGGPEDEVEQIADEALPGLADDLTRGLDRRARQADARADDTGIPAGAPGLATGGQYSPADLGANLAQDTLAFVDDAARAPGTALEAIETGQFVGGRINAAEDPSAGDPPRIYSDPLTATALGVASGAVNEPEQTRQRAEVVGNVGIATGEQAVEYAAENPREVGTEALAGAGVSAGVASVARGVGVVGRVGSLGTRSPDVDVDADTGATAVDVSDGSGGVRDVVGRVRERSPSVSVRRDAGASPLEIDPALRRQLRDATPDVNEVAREAGRRSRTAEINAQLRAQETAARARSGVRGVADTVRDVERPAVDIDSGVRDRVREATPDVDEAAREAGRRSRRAEINAQLQANEAISRTRDRIQGITDRDIDDVAAAEAADTTTADVFGRPRYPTMARLDADAATGAIRSAADRVSGAGGRIRDAVDSDIGGAVPGTAADTTTADVFGRPRYPAMARREVGAAADAVRGAGSRARGLLDRDINEVAAAEAADTTTTDVFGRPRYPYWARAEADAAREAVSDLREGASERISSAAGRVAAAREATIRIGPMRPQRAYVPEDALDEDDLMGPFADEDLSDLDSFQEAYDVDVDSSGRTRGGDARRVGQETTTRVRMEQETPETTRPRGDRQGDLNRGPPTAGVAGIGAAASDPLTGMSNRDAAATGTDIATDDATGTGLDTGLGTGLDTDSTPGLDTGLNTTPDLGSGTDVDIGQTPDLGERLDTGIDTGIRTTPEFDFGTPTTTETPPTEIETPTPRIQRPPSVPELPFDNNPERPEDTIGVDEESDTFGSGIVGNPFEER